MNNGKTALNKCMKCSFRLLPKNINTVEPYYSIVIPLKALTLVGYFVNNGKIALNKFMKYSWWLPLKNINWNVLLDRHPS